MCDTMVALSNSTYDGSVLFAKNSDREPNEASMLVIIPACDNATNSRVKCTYIEIPQVTHTNQVLLAKPFWMWGTEMGANEFGVVIGNEAVFSKEPYGKEPGLLGMDLIRLALERASSAYQALEIITTLLGAYGQSGNCGFTHKMYYHNSFLIADKKDAWVLETAGKEWAAEKVRDIRSISNGYTIQDKWDLASNHLIEHAIQKGWCRNKTEFNMARCYSDFLYTRFSDSKKRQQCSIDLLKRDKGKLSVQSMMRVLRFHGKQKGDFDPSYGILGSDVCMHAGFGPARGSQSAGSMITKINDDHVIHWLTGTSAPCTGVFKPVWIDSGLPEIGYDPNGEFNSDTLFWKHEVLHRAIIQNYPERIAIIQNDRDFMESGFLEKADSLKNADVQERRRFTMQCFTDESIATDSWIIQVNKVKTKKLPWHYQSAWARINKTAKFI